MVQKKKVDTVAEIAGDLGESKATVFVDFRGLTVGEATRLHADCRRANVRFRVVKNRLAKRAFAEKGLAVPEAVLRGPTALAMALEEPTGPARVLINFVKACEHLVIKGGFLGRKWLDAAAVELLSKIPPRRELLARLAGDLKSPLARLTRVLKASVSQLGIVLKAVAEKKAG